MQYGPWYPMGTDDIFSEPSLFVVSVSYFLKKELSISIYIVQWVSFTELIPVCLTRSNWISTRTSTGDSMSMWSTSWTSPSSPRTWLCTSSRLRLNLPIPHPQMVQALHERPVLILWASDAPSSLWTTCFRWSSSSWTTCYNTPALKWSKLFMNDLF